MTDQTEKISVHTKKYYRVVLEDVDPAQETPESFSIKLSMRTRTPLPRVRQVLRNLPYILKSDLSAAQANRLKTVIEEIGGRARLETHFVTPGRLGVKHEAHPSERVQAAENEPVVELRKCCPDCGWEEEDEATHCSLCLRRFRNENQRPKSLGARIPHENPLESQSFRQPDPEPEKAPTAGQVWEQYKLLIVAGGGLILLFVVLQILK